jgi:hypothetical protein
LSALSVETSTGNSACDLKNLGSEFNARALHPTVTLAFRSYGDKGALDEKARAAGQAPAAQPDPNEAAEDEHPEMKQ